MCRNVNLIMEGRNCGNTFVNLRIKNEKIGVTTVSNFILSFASKVPFIC